MPIPSPGDNQKEIYLMRTVPVAPSRMELEQPLAGFTLEDGIEMAIPEADPVNRTRGIPLSVMGKPHSSELSKVTSEDNPPKKIIISVEESAVKYSAGGTPQTVASFKLRYADSAPDGWMGIDSNWETVTPVPFDGAVTAADGETYTYDVGSNVAPVEDQYGNLLCFSVLRIIGSNPNEYRIICRKYNQRDDGAAVSFTTAGWSRKLITELNLLSMNAPQIAACKARGNEIYIVVVDQGAGSSPGDMHLFTWVPEASNPLDRFVVVSPQMAITSQDPNLRFMGGVTMEYAYDRLVIAAGFRTNSLAYAVLPGTYDYGIMMASSADFRNWITNDAGTTSMARFGGLDTVLQSGTTDIHVYGSERVNYKSLGGNIGGSFLAACTAWGMVYVSTDNGNTWQSTPSPCARGPASIALTCVRVIKDSGTGNYIIYAAGEKGYVQRSADSGKTWKILSPPSDMHDESNNTTGGIPTNGLPPDWNPFPNGWTPPAFLTVTAPLSTSDTVSSKYGFVRSDFFTNADGTIANATTNSVFGGEGINAMAVMCNSDTSNLRWRIWFGTKHRLSMIEDAQVPDNYSGTNMLQLKPVTQFYDYYTSILGITPWEGTWESPTIVLSGLFANEEHTGTDGSGHVYYNEYTGETGWQSHPVTCRLGPPLNGPVEGHAPVSAAIADTTNRDAYYKNFNVGFYFSTVKTGFSAASKLIQTGDNEGYLLTSFSNMLGKLTFNNANMHIQNLGYDNMDPKWGNAALRVRDLVDIVHSWATDDTIAGFDLKFEKADFTGGFIMYVGSNQLVGKVYRSMDGGGSWTAHFSNLDAVRCIAAVSQETVLVGASTTTSRMHVIYRAYPKFCLLNSGALMLAVSNITDKYVEVWKWDQPLNSDQGTPIFNRVNGPWSMWFPYNITFANSEMLPSEHVSMDTPQVWVLQANDGLVYMGADWKGTDNVEHHYANVCFQEDLAYWLPANYPSVPYPMNPIGTIDQYGVNVIALQYGGGRIMVMRGWGYQLLQTRHWTPIKDRQNIVDANGNAYSVQDSFPAPVTSNPVWIGVGDVSVVWGGSANRGDLYYLPVTYQFGKDQMAIDSPSFQYQSGDITNVIANHSLHAIWDRKAQTIVDVMGDGNIFHVNALGMFGSNIPFMKWAISTPNWSENYFPPDPQYFTEFYMNSVVHRGTFRLINTLNVIQDTSLAMMHDQYKSGQREYFLLMATSPNGLMDPTNCVCRRIIGNSHDCFVYEGDTLAFNHWESYYLDFEFEYILFTDRMFSDGSYGTRGGQYGYPVPALIDTQYEFGKLLRVSVPVIYPTPDMHLKIGTPWFGRQTPVIVQTPEGPMRRHKFSRGWRWRSDPNFLSEMTASGIFSGKHLGKTRQTFQLSWDQVEDWELNVFINLLSPEYMQPFAFLPNGDDPLSIELVRLDSFPDMQNQSGNYFNSGVTLVEVR